MGVSKDQELWRSCCPVLIAASSSCLPMKLRGRTEKYLGRDGELCVFISEPITFVFFTLA